MKYTKCLTDKCYFTGATANLECHHIFGGADRKNSEKYGLKVMLHHTMHNESPNGVHHNKEKMDELHKFGQLKFIESYPELDFASIFFRNYL